MEAENFFLFKMGEKKIACMYVEELIPQTREKRNWGQGRISGEPDFSDI